MVHKKQLSNTKKLAVNKAIDLMYSGKSADSLKVLKNHFSSNSDTILFFKGWKAQLENNHILAISLFEKSLIKNPLNEDALVGLATSYLEINNLSQALECAEQAILLNKNNPHSLLTMGVILVKSHPKDFSKQQKALEYLNTAYELAVPTVNTTLIVDILSAIGACYANQRLDEKARITLETVLEIDPYHTIAAKNLTSVYANLLMIDKAINTSKIAQMADSDEEKIDAMYQEGMLQLMLKNYAKGWRLHEIRLHSSKYKQKDMLFTKALDIKNVTEYDRIVLFQEQGIGDFLQFSRYIPLVSKLCKNIDIVILPNSYIGISDSIPSIKSFVELNFGKYINNVLVKGVDKIPDDYTYQASLMSLPYLFKTREHNIPSILPFITDKQTDLGSDKPLVGLFWKGSPHHSNDHNRSIDTNTIRELVISNPDITFVNFQLNETLPGIENVLHPDTTGLKNMLSILNKCDALITVDSMIAHLAGGANIPTYIMHAFSPDWRWGISKTTSEWYPSVTNIRQKQIGDWGNVILQVQDILNTLKNKLTLA